MGIEKYIGCRFERLQVLSIVEPKDLPEYIITRCSKVIPPYFKCLCDCGNITITRASNIKSVKSCGCASKEESRKNGYDNRFLGKYLKDRDQFLAGRVLKSYRYSAKIRGIYFDLNKEQILSLIKKPCYYCEEERSNILTTKQQSGYTEDLYYNGIDRVDSDLGYVYENLVPCCKICNSIKMDLSSKSFTDWLQRVYEWNIVGLKIITDYDIDSSYINICFAKRIKSSYIGNARKVLQLLLVASL